MDTFNRIANFLSGACSEQEKAEFEAWRRASPANEKEFRKFEKIWNLNQVSGSFNPDAAKAWEKVSACLFADNEVEYTAKRKINAMPGFQSAWKVAAAISLLLVAGFVWFLMAPSTNENIYEGLVSIKTNANERIEVTLPDGTRLWLNENSHLYYPEKFAEQERRTYLEGEAYFEVKFMPEKPFIIQAGTGEIKVLGTSFNIHARDKEKVKLQVVEGSVKFSSSENPAASVVVKAGEAAELEKQEVQSLQQNHNFLSWKTGEFIFHDTSLEEVLQTLENYYPVSFQTTDQNILKCRLTSQFRQQTIEEILGILDITLNLQHSFNKEKNAVTLSPTVKGQHCSGINF